MYTIPHGLLSTQMASELSLIRTVDTDKPVSQRLPRRRPISRGSSGTTQRGLAVPTSHVLAAFRQSSPLAWLFSFPMVSEPRLSPLGFCSTARAGRNLNPEPAQRNPPAPRTCAFLPVLGLALGMFRAQAAISASTTLTPYPIRLPADRPIALLEGVSN